MLDSLEVVSMNCSGENFISMLIQYDINIFFTSTVSTLLILTIYQLVRPNL